MKNDSIDDDFEFEFLPIQCYLDTVNRPVSVHLPLFSCSSVDMVPT